MTKEEALKLMKEIPQDPGYDLTRFILESELADEPDGDLSTYMEKEIRKFYRNRIKGNK